MNICTGNDNDKICTMEIESEKLVMEEPNTCLRVNVKQTETMQTRTNANGKQMIDDMEPIFRVKGSRDQGFLRERERVKLEDRFVENWVVLQQHRVAAFGW